MQRPQALALGLVAAVAAGSVLTWVLGSAGADRPPAVAPRPYGPPGRSAEPAESPFQPTPQPLANDDPADSAKSTAKSAPAGPIQRARPTPGSTPGLPSPAPASAPEAPAARATLRGVLLDHSGAPLSGVTVSATPRGPLDDDRPPASCVVDAGGGWSLEVSPGAWRVFAAPAPRASVDVVVAEGASQTVELAPPAPPWFSLRLLDEGHVPVALPRALARVQVGDRFLTANAAGPGEPLVVPLDIDRSRAAPASITVTVLPTDPRYRRVVVRVPPPAQGAEISITLATAPRLRLVLTLGDQHPSALVIVRSLPSEEPIAQRLGVGSQVDSEPEGLLQSTGIVRPLAGYREVTVEFGLDVDLPAAVRVDVTPLGGRPRSLDLTLADPVSVSRFDLRNPP